MSGISSAIRPFKDWTKQAGKRVIKGTPLVSIEKWNIKKGDMVEINTGRAAGTQGRVKSVIKAKNRVVVEGANMIKNFVKPTQTTPGGIIPKESPVHYSNVNLIDPSTGCVIEVLWNTALPGPSPHAWPHSHHTIPVSPPPSHRRPTKIKIRRNAAGAKERVAAKSGVVIPLPDTYGKLNPRFTTPLKPGSKDTDGATVSRVTYNPPPELIPYLSSKGVLFSHRGGVGELPSLPKLLRNKLHRKVRRRMIGEWEKTVEKQLLDKALPPRKVFDRQLLGRQQGLEGAQARSEIV